MCVADASPLDWMTPSVVSTTWANVTLEWEKFETVADEKYYNYMVHARRVSGNKTDPPEQVSVSHAVG